MAKSTKNSVLENKEAIDSTIFHSLFEHSISGILYGNPDNGNVLDANSAAAVMFGYTINELRKLNRNDIFDFKHPSMIHSLKTRQENGAAKGELIGIRKNGERFPCEFSSSIFKNEKGENRTSTMLNDISERKKNEEEIALFLNNTEESFVFIDKEFKIVYFNKQFNTSYFSNYKKQATKGDSIFDYALPERKEAVIPIFNKVLKGEIYDDFVEKPIDNGKSLFFEVKHKPAYDFLNNVIGIFVSTRNITEQKIIEKEMKLLLDNTEESFVLINKQLKIVSFNKKSAFEFLNLFKIKIYKGVNILDIVKKERQETLTQIYKRVFNGETIENEISFPLENKQVYYWIVYKPAIDNAGNIIGAFVTTKNITEKRKAISEKEYEHRNNEALINSTNDLIWSVDSEFKLIAANEAFIKTIKIAGDLDLKTGDNLLFGENFDPDFIAFWKQMYIRGLAGESFTFETQTPKRFPNVVYLETTINPIYQENEVVGVACYSRNITEAKTAFEQLKNSELEVTKSHEQLTKLTDSINTVVYQFEMTADGKMTFPFVSKSIYKMIPEVDVESLKIDGTFAFKHVHPNDIEGLVNSILASRDNLSYWNYEYRYVASDGAEKWISGSSHPTKNDDGTVVWYGYFQDITEQKNNQEKIKLAVERYDIIAKATNDTIWDIDIKNNTITWSEGIKLVYGYAHDEPNINNPDWWYTKIHPDDIEKVKKQNELWLEQKYLKFDQEYRFLCANNTYKYVFDRGFMLFDNNGTPIRITGAMQDITDRKTSELELEKILNLLNTTSRLAKIGGWQIDLVTNEHFWSPEVYNIWEIDKIFKPTIDKVLAYFTPESKSLLENAIQNGIDKGLNWDLELQANTNTGKLIDVRAQGSAIVKNKKTIKLIGTVQDITEQKIAVRKLHESELRFKTIFDAEPECVKLIDADGNIVEINKAGVKIHEAESEEHIKSIPIANFILPEYQKVFFDLHKKTMAGNHGFLEFEITGLKGTKRWLEAHSAPIYDADKNVSMMLSVTRDITERKIVEKALIESQKRFKTIFETVPECVKLVDAKGNVVEINDAGLEMLEVDSIESINSCRLSEFVLPKYQAKFLAAHKNAMNGKEDSLEFEIKGLKGTHRWLETYTVPIVNTDNRVEMMLAVTRDITKNKKEEHFLKLLESVVTNTNDSVMVTEIESKGMFGPKIVYVNDAFTRMTGHAAHEVIGKSPRILQGPSTDKKELKKLSTSMRNFKSSEITIINYRKNRKEFWVNFSVSPLADKNGFFTHWIAVGRDVTKNKNDDLEKEQIIAELSQNNKDLKQFSYVTSHNLRAPIANLLGLTSLIEQYKVSNKSLKQILDGVRQSALMFDDTVKDLTKVLVVKEQTNIVKEQVSFVLVIDNILKQLSISVDDNEVKVNYEFDKAPFVSFTTAYLESILLNLFTNSIRYKSNKRKLKIDIQSETKDDDVILKFKDNGIGIDTEKYKDKLFKLYQRFHDNPDGKGLGLYLIKSQIEALGGTIAIESKVDKGTTFIMKFKK